MNNNSLHHKLNLENQILKCINVKKKTLIKYFMNQMIVNIWIKENFNIRIKENFKIKEIINSL